MKTLFPQSPKFRFHGSPLFAGLLALVSSSLFCSSVPAQLSPFPETSVSSATGKDLPDILPPDVVEPVINPRQTSADQIARLFNRDLRDIEEAQADIIEQLQDLPRVNRESQRITGFGYHSGSRRSGAKWVQIDMGKVVSPDAIALFPVTVELEDETIYGYGFPKGFRVEISDDPEFRKFTTMVEGTTDGRSGVRRWPYFRELDGFSGRYIRVFAFNLWRPTPKGQPVFALSEVMVLQGEQNLAVGKPVTAFDEEERAERDQWSKSFLTDGITTIGFPQGDQESPGFGFRALSKDPATTSWVQVDLGENRKVDQVEIILADSPEKVPDPTVRFPYPMKVEISEFPDMRQAELIGRFNPSQISMIGANPLIMPVADSYGRYVRVTVQGPKKPGRISFDLAEIMVFSDQRNVALGKTVKALHPAVSKDWKPQFLVDGFSSRRNIVPYQEWLSGLSKRTRLVRRWLEKEERRGDLVDSTITRGVTVVAFGLAGILGFVSIALTRGRVQRRKDLEDLRQRIASDLHDDIGSNLSSIALLAELGKTEASEPELVVEELTEIKSTADKTIESMRDIVWLIRPGEETWQQMVTRFRETAAKLLRMHEYTFAVIGEAHDDRLPLEFKRDLFLIYKEVLNNIVRHAEAENVKIELDCRKNRIQMVIEDDGKGFNNLDKEFREGNGLRNLRMRAQAIGGNLKVRSTLNEGTMVQLTLPMP